MSANKLDELNERVRELENTVLKLKKDFNNTVYDLDEENFSRNFLKKINYFKASGSETSGESETT